MEILSTFARRDETPRGAMAGSANDPLGLLYPTKVQRIPNLFSDILEVPLHKVGWIGYEAVDWLDLDNDDTFGDRLLKETAAGHVILNYDPEGLGTLGCTWRLIWEREEVLSG